MLADTPLAKIDDIEFVRTVAVARILMPRSIVRLSAGRESMSESTQALCFLAGANSIFTGEKLLTTGNAGGEADAALFQQARPARHDGPRAGTRVAARVNGRGVNHACSRPGPAGHAPDALSGASLRRPPEPGTT